MKNIKNIIFDLGGVILNIDFKKTHKAFEDLGFQNFEAQYTLTHATPLFQQLEKGEITPEGFYSEFRKLFKVNFSDADIENAWNALLLDFPPENINLLKKLKQRYNTFLLSNTNAIHYKAFTALYNQQIGKGNFEDLFSKAYYSHELGLRKPFEDAYVEVLKQQNLNPAETLFIDDSLSNIDGARRVGLQTFHLVAPKKLTEIELLQ